MANVRFKFAVLKVLTKWPERRISLDEIRREIGTCVINESAVALPNHISVLADIDIFQSGLLSQNEQGLQITEAGLSLLQALENSDRLSQRPPWHLCRSRIFGLGERSSKFSAESGDAGNDHLQSEQEAGMSISTGRPEIISQATAANQVDKMNSPSPELTGNNPKQPFPHEDDREPGAEQPGARLVDAPAFLQRSFGSRTNAPRRPSALSSPFAFITQKRRAALNVWRNHFSRDDFTPTTQRPIGRIGSAAFSLLSLVTVVACLFAAIALGQIGSLKSNIAALQRELLPLKADLGRLELAEKARRETEQDGISKKNVGSKANGPDEETSNAPAALTLSKEEIQLIRDYIKPAPSAGSPAPDIRVGDLIGSTTMVPLPSSLTEKVPRLVGARFTTRNGVIVISTKRSPPRADLVLLRN